MDLVVDDHVIVEIKTVDRFSDAHFAQLNSYLRFSKLEVGLLLNFRTWPLREGGIKRVINTHPLILLRVPPSFLRASALSFSPHPISERLPPQLPLFFPLPYPPW